MPVSSSHDPQMVATVTVGKCCIVSGRRDRKSQIYARVFVR